MVGDFLLESKCKRGHASSATFRGYSRTVVEEVAMNFPDRCTHGVSEDEECGARIAHVICVLGTAVGPSSERSLPPLPPPPPPRKSTQPSMGAVRVQEPSKPRVQVVIVDDRDEEQSTASTEPPPSTRDP